MIFFAELVGGLVSGSLALLSDAMHMLSDAAGLIIALIAALIGSKEASSRATYGYRRVEVLAALFNAIAVTLVLFSSSSKQFAAWAVTMRLTPA